MVSRRLALVFGLALLAAGAPVAPALAAGESAAVVTDFGDHMLQMLSDPGVAEIIRRIMQEVEAVSKKLGMELSVSVEQRMAGAAKVGEHKTSMLQDLEAGRPMELEALVGSVGELGERGGVAIDHTHTVYSCARLLAQAASTNSRT